MERNIEKWKTGEKKKFMPPIAAARIRRLSSTAVNHSEA